MSALPIIRPPRQYFPIWERLKKEKVVSITTNRLMHPRIIKAVIKEKYQDFGYKIDLEPFSSELSYTVNNSIITFKLSFTLKSINGLEL